MTEIANAIETAHTEAVVDNLVTQFANAWDCFRELVQNSLDAGSSRIEVWTEFLPGEGHRGTMAFHVDDFGDGMDENIIDNQLTKLFASSKDGDLTKIGKFGIGFVSIFALNPSGVLLHTGRGGEYWEVLFHADRTFSKTQLDTPVEGTQITLFLEGDRHAYTNATRNILSTLKKWCKHSETEITFEDRETGVVTTINEPFHLEGLCAKRFVPESGTEFVMAFDSRPRYEFFNRGLTIASTEVASNVMNSVDEVLLGSFSFKVKSRYLEHTLSRDTVMRDENYRKVMSYLSEAAISLTDQLVREMEAHVATETWTVEDVDLYGRMLTFVAARPPELLYEAKILRGLHGGGYSAAHIFKIWDTDGRVLVDDVPSELTHRLTQAGVPVIFGRVRHASSTFPWHALTDILVGQAARAATTHIIRYFIDWLDAYRPRIASSLVQPSRVYLPVEFDDTMDPAWSAFLLDTADVLATGLNIRMPTLGTFTPLDATSCPIFLVVDPAVQRLKLPPVRGSLAKHDHLSVNRAHPHARRLHALYSVDPRLACYCMAKSLLLEEDRDLAQDQSLMWAAQGGRL